MRQGIAPTLSLIIGGASVALRVNTYHIVEKQKSYALPIAVMFGLFFIISFVTGLQNPFAVIVKEQFHASNFLSQLGNFANFLAYACMGMPAGLLLKRIGYRRTALWAVVVGFVGVGVLFLSGACSSFGVYLLGAFVSGFSMCMLNTVVNPMLNGLGRTERQGNQLIQFGGALNSIGATIAPVLVGYLMGANGAARTIASANPALFIAMGIFLVAFVVLLLVDIPEPTLSLESRGPSKHSAFSFRHFVLGVVAIFIYVGVEVGIPNIANLYMTTSAVSDGGSGQVGLGMDATVAGTLVGTYWFLMFVGRLIGGLVGGRVGSRTMLTSVALLAVVFVCLAIVLPSDRSVTMPVFQSDISFGMARVPVSVMFLVLCGLCTSVMWGGIFNLAVSGLGRYTAVASGAFMMMVCGGGVLPVLQGWLADVWGFMNSYWLVVAGLAYILFYALWGSKNVNTDIPVD